MLNEWEGPTEQNGRYEGGERKRYLHGKVDVRGHWRRQSSLIFVWLTGCDMVLECDF